MPMLFRRGVTGAKGTGGRWRLVVDGVGGWGLSRHGIVFRLYDHNGEHISEGSFDKCLDDAAAVAALGVDKMYADEEE